MIMYHRYSYQSCLFVLLIAYISLYYLDECDAQLMVSRRIVNSILHLIEFRVPNWLCVEDGVFVLAFIDILNKCPINAEYPSFYS